MTFQDWLAKVSRRLAESFEVDIFDFVDRNLVSWYAVGVRPGAAVVALLTDTEPALVEQAA